MNDIYILETTFGELLTPYDDFMEHSGTPGHSGRYPLGSGKRPFQRFGPMNNIRRIDAKYAAAFRRAKSRVELKDEAKATGSTINQVKERRRVNKIMQKDPSQMTDAELAKAIARLQQEKQYKQLLNDSRTSEGKAFANYMKKNVLWKSIANVSSDLMTKEMKKAMGVDTKKKQNND